ncbi:MAG: Lrp/AsnC family transcriptional regulator [Candidatus Parvarchaeota archaeon]|nr:Lrp/AsnC family transcriptional regulator [Candidatus Jingweiarchaeum tengchongense]
MKKIERTFKMDEMNKKILRELILNSRQSLREISKTTNISIGTIANRIKLMQSSGVIKGYTTIIDPDKVGYELMALIGIVISKGKLIQVEKVIASYDNVMAVYDVTGEYDAFIIARFKDREHMSRFIKSLLSTPNIERTHTYFVLNTVKEDFRLFK